MPGFMPCQCFFTQSESIACQLMEIMLTGHLMLPQGIVKIKKAANAHESDYPLPYIVRNTYTHIVCCLTTHRVRVPRIIDYIMIMKIPPSCPLSLKEDTEAHCTEAPKNLLHLITPVSSINRSLKRNGQLLFNCKENGFSHYFAETTEKHHFLCSRDGLNHSIHY